MADSATTPAQLSSAEAAQQSAAAAISESGLSPPLDVQDAPGPSRLRAADKWVKENGPPVGVQFGARRIQEGADLWSQNAWDHVELPEDYLVQAQEKYKFQASHPVDEGLRDHYNVDPARHWDKFYASHQAAFFKDRNWLRSEFPELIACSEADAGPKTVLEVGCGAGNSIFTLMKYNENPELTVYATDYSYQAVEVVKSNEMYPVPAHGKGKINAQVWDITSKPPARPSSPDATAGSLDKLSLDDARSSSSSFSLPYGLKPGSVDVLTVIYVLSALHPKEWNQAIHNLYTALKPGGILLLRDYGRNDLAQIRIKKDRLLEPNLYIRGDGTRVYFFEQDEVKGLLEAAPRSADGKASEASEGMFDVTQIGEDRRMIVNRKERLQMYRIWLQVKATKR